MRAYVNKDTCIACETCVGICPEVFSMNSDGKAVAITADVPLNEKNSVIRSRNECPVSAIDIKE